MRGRASRNAVAAERPARRWKTVAAAVAVIAAFGVLHVLTYVVGWRLVGENEPVETAVWRAGMYMASYVLGGGGLVWLGRRYPLTRERWAAVLAGDLLAVLVAILLFTALRLALWPYSNPLKPVDWWATRPGIASFRTVFLTSAPGLVLIFTLFLCAGHTSVYFARDRDAEVRRNRLHAELANARLQAVQFQLQPQLVFAAFHALAALMRTDVEAAERLLLQIASLMRAMLRRVDTPLVPLRDEAAALEALHAVARATATPYTPASLDIPVQAEWALVPPSVLQRLVGVAELLRGGAPGLAPVRLRATWSAAWLELHAATPRAGAGEGAAQGELERMRAWLAELYGDEMSLTLAPRDGAAELALQVPLLTALPRDTRPEQRPPARAAREIGVSATSGSASAPGPGTSA